MMNYIIIELCALCERAYHPEEIARGVSVLKQFKGYTVDVRLRQFRKLGKGHGYLEFVDFDSPKGQMLLQAMHEDVLKHIQQVFHDDA